MTEKNVVEVAGDAAVNIMPTAEDKTEIAGKVAEVSALPVGEGQFPLKVTVTGDVPEWIVPGMTCKVKVTTYTKDDALTVPAAAVRTDEEDKQKKYVLVQVEGEDQPQRRDVEVGKTNDGKTEILAGVQAGEQVVLGDPKAAEKSGEKPDEKADEKPAEEEAKDTEADQAEKDEDKPAEEPEGDAENDAENASEVDE